MRAALASLALLVGCGSAASMAEEGLPAPVCDLRSLATSLVGAAELCPPSEVFVFPSRNEATPSPVRAEWDGEKKVACTRFTIDGSGCPDACAPVQCRLEGERVECDSASSPCRNRTTCYVLPESACSKR